MAAHRVAWKNDKHAAQWPATLKSYAYPIIGELPLQLIDTTLVMKVIEPLWSEKPETASRLRGRIESVLDWATVRGYRQGENPARWRGHLDQLLPARAKVRKVKHHSALPYAELPAFLVKLREQEGVAARALEFTILTAARTSETIGAKLSEIDRKNKLWTVPAERMKAGKDHRVPLSDRALEILEEVGSGGDDKDSFVFRSRGLDEPLSNMAMLKLLQRMGRGDLTVHGFRSTFRDWAAERRNFRMKLSKWHLRMRWRQGRGRISPWRSFREKASFDAELGTLLLPIELDDNVVQLQSAHFWITGVILGNWSNEEQLTLNQRVQGSSPCAPTK